MSIKLHGKEYVEVKDRVLQAHKEESYSMLSEETFSMGGREYVRVFIDVKGKQYIGTAECKFNANPKTPDGQSPFECGETSALGRALGFAGYGVTESIASFDEVARNDLPERVLARETVQEQPSNGHASPEAKFAQIDAEIEARLDTLKADFLKMFKPAKWEGFKMGVIGVGVPDDGLDEKEIARLADKLAQIRREQEAAKASVGTGK